MVVGYATLIQATQRCMLRPRQEQMQQHPVWRVLHGADYHTAPLPLCNLQPGEDQTRLATTCIPIFKLAGPKAYLCDLANLGLMIEILSAAEVQYCSKQFALRAK